jgi:hypothetical protein
MRRRRKRRVRESDDDVRVRGGGVRIPVGSRKLEKESDLARSPGEASLGGRHLPYTPNTLYGEIPLSIWWHLPAIARIPRLQTQYVLRRVVHEEIV